jgi:hypothetical protein
MTETVRVRLYWDDGRVEEPRQPIERSNDDHSARQGRDAPPFVAALHDGRFNDGPGEKTVDVASELAEIFTPGDCFMLLRAAPIQNALASVMKARREVRPLRAAPNASRRAFCRSAWISRRMRGCSAGSRESTYSFRSMDRPWPCHHCRFPRGD